MSAICVCTHKQMWGRDDRLRLYLAHLTGNDNIAFIMGPPCDDITVMLRLVIAVHGAHTLTSHQNREDLFNLLTQMPEDRT